MPKWDGTYTWDRPPSQTGTPDRLKVATCQFPVVPDLGANLAHVLDLIGRAAVAGADVAHFPECAISGYGPANWPDWTGFDWAALDAAVGEVRAAARARGIWVVAGCAHREAEGRKPFNSLYVIDRQGEIVGRYDKQRCSDNDRRAFIAGERPLVAEIDGVRCGFLICLDWSFPELWQDYFGEVELLFHSAVSDSHFRDKNATLVIPSLMQSYAWLHVYAISLSNSCRPGQDFPSLWIERSGHIGGEATRHETGLTINALSDDPEQDRFFNSVIAYRKSLREKARVPAV